MSETNQLRDLNRDMTYSPDDQVLTAGDKTYDYDVDGFLKKKIGQRIGVKA